ncbi:MAG: transposase, partial [Opitutales bacterium]
SNDRRLPEVARACVAALGVQLRMLKAQILEFDRLIMAWHRSNETSRRLDEIPGIGPALATALVASVADPKAFRSARHFSAWVGLVPKQHSSGGKERLGSISKQGDRYLRSLLTAGALAVIRYAKIHGTKHRPWLTALHLSTKHLLGILTSYIKAVDYCIFDISRPVGARIKKWPGPLTGSRAEIRERGASSRGNSPTQGSVDGLTRESQVTVPGLVFDSGSVPVLA